ncbi:head-tail connector protein [Pantoea stewartii]
MPINVLDVVPITELRQHIEMDSDDRDAVLTRYAQGSLDYCIRFCDDPRWKTASDLPSQVVNAMLLFSVTLSSTEGRRLTFSSTAMPAQMTCCCR